jgi:hypothetical protein
LYISSDIVKEIKSRMEECRIVCMGKVHTKCCLETSSRELLVRLRQRGRLIKMDIRNIP